MSPENRWCLDPLDPKDCWTSLDLVPQEGKAWTEDGSMAEAGEAKELPVGRVGEAKIIAASSPVYIIVAAHQVAGEHEQASLPRFKVCPKTHSFHKTGCIGCFQPKNCEEF